MTARVLELVANVSEGRDPSVIEAILEAVSAAGATVVDWSADPDHHRAVITAFGSPAEVEEAAVGAARVAVERIDLGRHAGVHPRIGALDVLPFVPLVGVSMEEARAVARRAGRRLAHEVGVPVYYYAGASDPPGQELAELRRGGFEALVLGWPEDRVPDVLPEGWAHPGAHPTAGATCVGARGVLLAWNVFLDDISLEAARAIAVAIRERDGGFPGLRALALTLPGRKAVQISMNLEDPRRTSPLDVLRRIEELAAERGGRAASTEVVGLVPDELVTTVAVERLRLERGAADRLLSRRLVEYLAALENVCMGSE